ncbi:hypothetical protein QZJ86_17725 [Methylomonas montana]|uniref:hypothetical protein n=1 Tax=Methylomonas montana TaxID=3058963 RepID=UPI002657C774|nr:hypothetical protein [Methylomonas montana]WKJ89826.1 hypothetical protein QZJ86_17725 [Methylomonas montana]
MTAIVLTEEQREIIRRDMDSQIEMLSDEEVEALASKLNKKIDIPFIPEGTEQVIFVKTVKQFDRMLYQSLPNELYGLVKNASAGISEKDAEALKLVLGTRLNNRLDIPYVPEWVEQEIFELLLDLIVKAMRKKYSIIDQTA